MARVQTDYSPRPEGPAVTAAPNFLAIQERVDPRSSSAYQLAEALGAAAPEIERTNQMMQDRERDQAKAYANSMTVDQLGQKIKSGEMLPSQSPLFAATLQHIYGENSMASLERDTMSKIQTGQVQFKTQEELDNYLTEARNKHLEGQSRFAIAGFDKGWDQFKASITTANSRIENDKYVQRGTEESTDNLQSVLTQVTAPGFTGTKEEAAKAIADRYTLLRSTALLRDDQAKDAMHGLLSSVAQSGDQALMDAMLKQKLDNGVTVQALMGATRAAQLQQHTLIQDDKNQRQRVDVELRPFVFAADKGELEGKARKEFDDWITKNERWVNTGTIHGILSGNDHAKERLLRQLEEQRALAQAQATVAAAQQTADAYLAQGNFAFLQPQKVLSPTGEAKDFDAKKYATERLHTMGAGLPFDKQVQLWETNGLTNPQWEKEVQAGVHNVASVGWTFDGKNIGQLNQQGQAAIQRYLQIAAVSPAAADKMAGKDAQLLSDIKFMIERGGTPDVSQAAAFVNQANHSGIEKGDMAGMKERVSSAVSDVVYPHFWSRTTSWVAGFFGNDQVNLTQVRADIRRRAELLVQTGQVSDPAAAVKASVEYLSNPQVTTKINNTLYMNKDLPTMPKGEDTAKWMERFIEEVPGKLAKDRAWKASDVRLEPNQSGGFMAWAGNVPITDKDGSTVNYTKQQVSSWVNSTMTSDRVKAVDDKNYKLYRDRILREIRELPRGDTDHVENGRLYSDNIYTRDAWEKLRKEKLDGKPLTELYKITKERAAKK